MCDFCHNGIEKHPFSWHFAFVIIQYTRDQTRKYQRRQGAGSGQTQTRTPCKHTSLCEHEHHATLCATAPAEPVYLSTICFSDSVQMIQNGMNLFIIKPPCSYFFLLFWITSLLSLHKMSYSVTLFFVHAHCNLLLSLLSSSHFLASFILYLRKHVFSCPSLFSESSVWLRWWDVEWCQRSASVTRRMCSLSLAGNERGALHTTQNGQIDTCYVSVCHWQPRLLTSVTPESSCSQQFTAHTAKIKQKQNEHRHIFSLK